MLRRREHREPVLILHHAGHAFGWLCRHASRDGVSYNRRVVKLRLFILAAILACGVDSRGPGNLGVLTFEPASGTNIAVGAQFAVVTDKPANLTSANTSLAAPPTSPRWIPNASSAVFEAKAAGTVAIIANASDGAKALDFIEVNFLTPNDLSIVFGYDGGAGPKDHSGGLKAIAKSSGVPLEGDYGCTWSVSDPFGASVTYGSGGFASWFWLTDAPRNTASFAITDNTELITITATCLGLTTSITKGANVDAGKPSDASAPDASDAATTDAADASDDVSDASDAND